ncbi:MAG: Acylphosphatase [Verrucomicrobia subdivision 3 bacterium]|nr:Acylphosphatase [Limisphaerales bacterium]MCS1417384.1 Acylphosphatase [Limisphaerales bacterium]
MQGVGFRYTVKRLVCGFEVCGFVQNLPDGRVKLVVEGDEEELKAFLVTVRESGLGPVIRDEESFWSEATNEFRGFDILR